MFSGYTTQTHHSNEWFVSSSQDFSIQYNFSNLFIETMTDKEVLTRAMATAVRNGYDLGEEFFTETPTEFYLMEDMDLYFSLVFDHEFAKAFWGCDIIDQGVYDIVAWEFHLQEMVLKDKPLDYIRKFIEDEETC